MASTNFKSIGAAAALTIAVGLGVGSPAGAADSYTPSSQISVSDSTPTPGQSITLSGKTTPDTVVTVTITAVASTQSLTAAAATTYTLGSTTSNANGDYSLTVTIPASLPAGSYVLAASAGGTVISSANLSVAAPTQATPPSTTTNPVPEKLAFTGSESAPMAAVALAIVGAGGALVLLARRNDHAIKSTRR